MRQKWEFIGYKNARKVAGSLEYAHMAPDHLGEALSLNPIAVFQLQE